MTQAERQARVPAMLRLAGLPGQIPHAPGAWSTAYRETYRVSARRSRAFNEKG
jgi:hypothetical protein